MGAGSDVKRFIDPKLVAGSLNRALEHLDDAREYAVVARARSAVESIDEARRSVRAVRTAASLERDAARREGEVS